MRRIGIARGGLCLLLSIACLAAGSTGGAHAGKRKEKAEGEERYAQYVWPPPPDTPRIRLVDVIRERRDVEAESKWKKMLIGASPASPYDRLRKPFAVAIDAEGRLLVSDSGSGAIVRFDREGHRMDVLGTQGPVRLRTPLGLGTGPGGIVYVADPGVGKILAYDREGKMVGLYGKKGDLVNPTDVAPAADGSRLYVADSKAHRIVVFNLPEGNYASAFGRHGDGDGEFAYPTSIAIGPEGNLYVVDQLNARVQIFTRDGDYMDQLGGRGVGYGDLVRPKDVAVDDSGFIYVTDNAFNNIQIFDADFTLLTFVGEAGYGPGQFTGASGVAVRGNDFAVVDQLGRRLQLFRYIGSRTGG